MLSDKDAPNEHVFVVSQRRTQKEVVHSMEVFDELMRCVERNQAELLRTMKEKQRAAEQRAEEFVKELEEGFAELKRRDAELEQLSRTDDPLHFLQVRVRLFLRGKRRTWHDRPHFPSLLPYCRCTRPCAALNAPTTGLTSELAL